MASVKIGRCGHLRFLSRPGISLEMGVAAMLWLDLADVQAVLKAQDQRFCASGQLCGRTTGVLADVVDVRAVKIASDFKHPVGACNPSGESFSLSAAGARMRSKWSAGILGLFDPDLKKMLLGPAGAREAGLWQEIGLGQTMAEFADELAAIEVV
jgi:hypothetical protein